MKPIRALIDTLLDVVWVHMRSAEMRSRIGGLLDLALLLRMWLVMFQ
jgi:hypothetical protein